MMYDKALVYIHGKGGTADSANEFKSLFPEYDIYGFDYKSENPWEAEIEFKEYFTDLAKKYSMITVIATSLGAYSLMISGVQAHIHRAYFVSPIVNMERLIQDMMKRGHVSNEELEKKKIIQLSTYETLSWEYYTWVKQHPIVWRVPTFILYGENDNFQTIDTINRFAESVGAKVTVMLNGEHWFHTPEQNEFRRNWLRRIIEEELEERNF